MLYQENLEMLKQGVEVWNEWKRGYLDKKRIFSRVMLSFADLSGMNLEGAHLEDVDLQQANLSEANLKKADLSVSSLISANLSGADLRGAVLEGTECIETNFKNANLSGANLTTALLLGADLSDANLLNTDLRRADLREVNLNGADLSEAKMEFTIFGDVDLGVVKGLETVKHSGPSTIGIDVIYRSHGQIPEIFLQGTGVPDPFIIYARSLAGKLLRYYTCFISYSSKDEAFVRQLYSDLQSKGVRCWFAPEDLKIGDRIRPRIDESIRLYNKLLLVLSEHSVASNWVEHEVEMALAKEYKEKRTVLFPVRLDTAILEREYDGWPALVRHERYIGDFTRWKDPDIYHRAFDRLLQDLKAETAQGE